MTLHAYLGLLGEGMHCNLDPKVLIRVHPCADSLERPKQRDR